MAISAWFTRASKALFLGWMVSVMISCSYNSIQAMETSLVPPPTQLSVPGLSGDANPEGEVPPGEMQAPLPHTRGQHNRQVHSDSDDDESSSGKEESRKRQRESFPTEILSGASAPTELSPQHLLPESSQELAPPRRRSRVLRRRSRGIEELEQQELRALAEHQVPALNAEDELQEALSERRPRVRHRIDPEDIERIATAVQIHPDPQGHRIMLGIAAALTREMAEARAYREAANSRRQLRLEEQRRQEAAAEVERAQLAEIEHVRQEFKDRIVRGERNLQGWHLEGFDLRGLNLSRADLRDAHLEGAMMQDIILNGANLTGVFLTNAHLEGAKLNRANFTGAHMDHVHLDGAELNSAIFSGADLTGASIDKAKVNNIRIDQHAILSGASLKNLNFWEAIIRDSDCSGVQLENVGFLNCGSLAHLNMAGSVWQGVSLESTSLIDINFASAKLNHVCSVCSKIIGSNLNFNDAEINSCNFFGAVFVDEATRAPGLEVITRELERQAAIPKVAVAGTGIGVGTVLGAIACFVCPIAAPFCVAGSVGLGLLGEDARDNWHRIPYQPDWDPRFAKINGIIENSTFERSYINSSVFGGLVFKNCPTLNVIRTARGSAFDTVGALNRAGFFESLNFLTARGACVNDVIDEQFQQLWGRNPHATKNSLAWTIFQFIAQRVAGVTGGALDACIANRFGFPRPQGIAPTT